MERKALNAQALHTTYMYSMQVWCSPCRWLLLKAFGWMICCTCGAAVPDVVRWSAGGAAMGEGQIRGLWSDAEPVCGHGSGLS